MCMTEDLDDRREYIYVYSMFMLLRFNIVKKLGNKDFVSIYNYLNATTSCTQQKHLKEDSISTSNTR